MLEPADAPSDLTREGGEGAQQGPGQEGLSQEPPLEDGLWGGGTARPGDRVKCVLPAGADAELLEVLRGQLQARGEGRGGREGGGGGEPQAKSVL